MQAYQLLLHGGVKPENIITMMYNDIAHNEENPHRGKIFNKPGGKDVYAGVVIVRTGVPVGRVLGSLADC